MWMTGVKQTYSPLGIRVIYGRNSFTLGPKGPQRSHGHTLMWGEGASGFRSCFRAQRRFAGEEGYTCGIDLCHPGCPPQDNSMRPHLSVLQEATVTVRPLWHCHRWVAPEWTEWIVRDIGDHITRIFQGLLQSPPYSRVRLHCTHWLWGTWGIGSKQMQFSCQSGWENTPQDDIIVHVCFLNLERYKGVFGWLS